MRVAQLARFAALAVLVPCGSAQADPQGAQFPICAAKVRNEIRLSTTLGSDGCPQQPSVAVDPTCLAVTYTGQSWPSIRWVDASPQGTQIRWQIDPVAGNAHGHLGTVSLAWAQDAGLDTRSVHAGHASGSCTWYYRVTAVARGAEGGECSASIDPGIRFNPGGGGALLQRYWWVAAAGVLLLAYWLYRRRGRPGRAV